MIAAAHQRLRNWIAALTDNIEISMSPPGREEETGSGVHLYLMEVSHPVITRQDRNRVLQLTLRYLITVWSPQAEEAHELLEKLLVSAMENADVQIESEPPPLSFWAAYGLSPRPSFILRCTLQHEQPERVGTIVRSPPLVRSAPLRRLEGIVLGPEDIPLGNARVQAPGQGLTARTDPDGRFRFLAMPADAPVERLAVEVRGQTVSVSVGGGTGEQGAPLILRCQPAGE
jgi:hypothetical protein